MKGGPARFCQSSEVEGGEPDFVGKNQTVSTPVFSLMVLYSIDSCKHNTIRYNQDVKINPRGRDLVELRKSANLTICNRRTMEDLYGDFTVSRNNMGTHLVDYTIVDKTFMNTIVRVKVG